jgi:hypothetical protein
MSKSRDLANLLGSGGSIQNLTSAGIDDNSTSNQITVEDDGVTITNDVTVDNLHVDSTGAVEMPAGTTAERPTGVAGMTRFNTDLGYMEFYTGTAWYPAIPPAPEIAYSSGNILAGAASTITFSGSNLGTNAGTFNFIQEDDAIDVDVASAAPSSGYVSVTVPSSVYSNVTAGNDVSVIFTSEYNEQSSPVSITATSLPTGGTVTTTGNYRVHTFTSSDNFVATFDLSNIEYLIIGGGGSGGSISSYPNRWHSGGGGGAGGYRCSVSGESSGGGASAESPISSLSSGTYPVVVGGSGSSSSFNSITSLGGGAGGDPGLSGSYTGFSGGSGGGGSALVSQYTGATNYSGGSGTAGQGYGGSSGSSYFGGNGGGAGAAGTSAGSAGSAGVESSIDGTATYRAGAGTGGASQNQDSATPQHGGGQGASRYPTYASSTAGTVNTGGGGGGGSYDSGALQKGFPTGAAGGSGIVILRYQL